MASLDELRALGTVLPPNERVSSGEVADVVSALQAVEHHGPEVLAAAQRGMQALADFFHDRAVERAKDAGDPEPQRGDPVTRAPATTAIGGTATPVGGVSAAEFNDFKTQVLSALQAIAGQRQAPEPAQPTPEPAQPVAPGPPAVEYGAEQ